MLLERKSASVQVDFATNRVVPELATTLNPKAKPNACFVVYPDKGNTARAQIEVQFAVNGKALARQAADLPRPDARGAIPWWWRPLESPANAS